MHIEIKKNISALGIQTDPEKNFHNTQYKVADSSSFPSLKWTDLNKEGVSEYYQYVEEKEHKQMAN